MLKYLLLRSRGWWIYTEGGGKLALALVDPARVSGETAGGGRCGGWEMWSRGQRGWKESGMKRIVRFSGKGERLRSNLT